MDPFKMTCTEEKYLISKEFDFNFPVIYSSYPQLTQQQFYQRVYDQDILIINDLKVDQIIFEHNPHLKLIALCGTGYDQIDLALAQQRGVKVCNIRGYANDTVAEHAFLLMLSLMKNLAAYQHAVFDGRWSHGQSFCLLDFPIFDLKSKNLVIVGKGEIGQALAHKAQAFGMNVIYAERKNSPQCRSGYMPFIEAMQMADVVSLHCPLSAENAEMIDLVVLGQMKSSCCLINVSRGGLIDEQALCFALQHHFIGGYAADVMRTEPPAIDHPFLQLGANTNLILTPHIAWASVEARTRMFEILNQNINLNCHGINHNRVV